MPKAYIIATPCSGKSFFALQYNRSVGNVYLIDQDNISSKLVHTGIINQNASENEKANYILEHFNLRDESSVLLGSYLPSNPLDYPEITMVCVILPKPKQLYYVIKRRLHHAIYQILHFLSTSKDFEPNKKWSNWSNILQRRDITLAYANSHSLQVFNNLQMAIHWLDQR